MLGEIIGKLKFLYGKQRDNFLRRLLLNALIQPYFDYACTLWYPVLSKSLSKKFQTNAFILNQLLSLRVTLIMGWRSKKLVTHR